MELNGYVDVKVSLTLDQFEFELLRRYMHVYGVDPEQFGGQGTASLTNIKGSLDDMYDKIHKKQPDNVQSGDTWMEDVPQ